MYSNFTNEIINLATVLCKNLGTPVQKAFNNYYLSEQKLTLKHVWDLSTDFQ